MIYHISTASEWQHAQTEGAYRAPSLDSEGFIHCSTAAQVVPVANFLYKGQTDLVLLCIEPDQLTAEVKWEPPAHPNPDDPVPTEDAELFPHVYGPINTQAVTAVVDFPAGPDSQFALPPDLPV